jgi:hypothetical protein
MNPIGSWANFPQGFAGGLAVRGMPLLQTQPGQVLQPKPVSEPVAVAKKKTQLV